MTHKKVLLLRHGKTQGNIEKRYIGKKTDESLSGNTDEEFIKARESIEAVFEPLTDGVALYSSPLKRAVETSEKLFEGMTPQTIDELSEIDFGDFEGKNYNDLKDNPDYQRWIDSNGTIAFPGGEDRAEFIERSCRGFYKVVAEKSEEAVAIVCHGGNIMSILSTITGDDYFDFMTHNLGGYVLEFDTENERISDFTYNRIDLGGNS